jgi:hypothetical protein
MEKNMLVVLGASDPEMALIEELCRDYSIPYAYCVGADSRRVHPGNAYQACGLQWPGQADGPGWGDVTHLVECSPSGEHRDGMRPDVVVIDHHRPGDPGYGRGPEEFLAASSVGQFIAELARLGIYGSKHSSNDPAYDLWGGREKAFAGAIDRRKDWQWDYYVATTAPASGGVIGISSRGARRLSASDWEAYGKREGGMLSPDERRIDADSSPRVEKVTLRWVAIPHDIVMAAAADHCLEAAYRGRCPGVDPDALMRWRADSRAAFQRRPVEAVLADIEAARQRLRTACAGLTSLPYADLRGESIPELPEAAAREGIPFLADQTDRSGRRKVVLMAAPPGLVQQFLAGEIVPGLVDYYGDPARGFAGGYIN